MSLQVHVLIECLERDVSDERDPGYLYCLLPLHRTRQILAPYPLQQGTHNAPTIRIRSSCLQRAPFSVQKSSDYGKLC